MSFSKFTLEVLQIHNEYRKKHSAPPLTLNNEMCDYAQKWAEHCANRNKMEHSPNNKYGENIYYYWHSDKMLPTARAAVETWYVEIKKYTFGKEPASKGTGHFTQLVWKDSRQLGVGIATNKEGTTYVVAEYDPPGNWKNEYKENVLPPSNN